MIAFFIASADQATKFIIEALVPQNTYIILTSFLRISHIKNTGSAFGILQNTNALFAALTLLVIIGIIYFFDRIPEKKLALTGYSLILGGAIGNLADRIFLGGVIDFIDFKFWPAFNIADSALTLGIILLLFYYYGKK